MNSLVVNRLNDVRKTLRDFLSLPGFPVVDQNQYRTHPKPPYISYKLITNFTKQAAFDELLFNRTDQQFYLKGHRQITASVQARGIPFTDEFRKGYVSANDILANVQWFFDHPSAVAMFHQNRIVIVRDMGVIDATILEDNAYVPRANMDVMLRIALHERVPMEWIQKVEITGRVDTNFDGIFNTEIGPVIIQKPEV
jgi:hypothetical protein